MPVHGLDPVPTPAKQKKEKKSAICQRRATNLGN